jgi:hypothetical protein
MGGNNSKMTEQKQLVDLILEVLNEMNATDSHPQHRSRFNPIVEVRWKKLGNTVAPDTDFGQQVSAELHRYSSDASKWNQMARKGTKNPDLFKMHRRGYWSIRGNAPRELKRGPELGDL